VNIEEYTREKQRAEDQTIVGYLGGLDPKYVNVIELQQYFTFNEIRVLDLRMEPKQNPDLQNMNSLDLCLRTNHLTRGLQIHLLSPQPQFPQLHKEPLPHKRTYLHKINPTLVLWALKYV